MRVDFHWQAYKYLPYERTLARRELVALLGREPISRPGGLSIETPIQWEKPAYRVTYFCEAIAEDGKRIVPLQTTLEASVNGKGQHRLIDKSTVLRRQSTRYSAHGLHEYRGKFNPQIVRAIGNMLGLKQGDWVLDPFCGSGTTLLEAAHIGWNAIGVDLNPLGVQIARAKITAMRIPLEQLCKQSEILKQRLIKRFRDISFDSPFTSRWLKIIGAPDWKNRLPSFDYLRVWFTESVLVQLAAVLDEIAHLPSGEAQLILRVILSDILRQVSLQDPADLRIRRRKSPPENAPVIPLYLDSLTNKIENILKARKYINNIRTIQDALFGDVRTCASAVRAHPRVRSMRHFHAAITSPPYATALPYIDTQRLSLVLLGLISADEIRATERTLIGNREITTRERLKIEHDIEKNSANLPTGCLALCRKLKNAVNKNRDGFRRQNVPVLIYKYCTDMSSMFKQVYQLLTKDAPFALVVGRNKTRLGDRHFIIDTPYLLASLAEANGFEVQETLKLDTYQRYDVHQTNSIRSETLAILRRR